MLSTLLLASATCLSPGTENISDSLTSLHPLPIATATVDRTELTADHRTNILPTLCEQVPGLMVAERSTLGFGIAPTGSGQLKVRGLGGSSGVMLTMDRIPLNTMPYGTALPDALLTMMAEQVEVVRGPSAAQYATGAMAGAINLQTRMREKTGHDTEIDLQAGSYGTMQATAQTSLRLGMIWGAAGAQLSRSDGHNADNKFMQQAGFAKIGANLGKHWQLMGNGYLTYFENSSPASLRQVWQQKDTDMRNAMLGISLFNHYERSKGAVRGYYNWGEIDASSGYQAGLLVNQDYALGKNSRIEMGIDYTQSAGDIQKEESRTRKEDHELALYAHYEHRLLRFLSLNASLRYAHHSRMGSEWTPRAGASLHLPFGLTATASISKGHRNPTMGEQLLYDIPDGKLHAERLVNYEAGVEQSLLKGKIRWSLSAFHLKASNLIATAHDGETWKAWNTDATRHNGIEAYLNIKPLDMLHINANYSYLAMEQAQQLAPRHKAYVGASARIWHLNVSGGLQYIGQLCTTPGDDRNTENITLLHLTVGYKLLGLLNFYIKGDNLLGQSYHLLPGYPMPKATVMAGVSVKL